ncbi:hypothetical protein GDO78_011411 [Eleutherodactylus coqui]|uniref:RING-type E3 ubiquitin transferase n=1 Tax=Eleutherodactylus coqui TaxID=57060 RepID=A0A8J6F711_ELECQ|nr:hypothetical protein GDO78_011411 [Eleutherodactylus coqui]
MGSPERPSVAQIVLLASSSAVTAIFYSVYRHKYRTAQTLKGAKKISIDDDLPNVLMDLPGKCVPYAVIEGRNDQEKVIHQRTNTVPFDLTRDDSDEPGPSIRIIKPLDAAELDLETVYEKFHPAVQSFSNVLGHFLTGERPKGIQETEEMLKIGAPVTGVGELVLDNKLLKLQPPKAGMLYYLSSMDFDSLVQRQESRVQLWKILTVICGVATCVTLFFILRRQYRQHKEKQRLKQLQKEFEEANSRFLDGENEEVRNACTICLSNQKSCVFLECGHVCSCNQCYQALPVPKKCPICRNSISRMVPLFNS